MKMFISTCPCSNKATYVHRPKWPVQCSGEKKEYDFRTVDNTEMLLTDGCVCVRFSGPNCDIYLLFVFASRDKIMLTNH